MKRLILPCLLLCLPSHAEDLTTTEGKVYKGVTIRKVEPDGLAITHESGLAKVPFTKLSKEIQQKHGYDPEKGKEFAEKQAAEQRAADAAMEKGLKESKTKEAREAAIKEFTEGWSEIAIDIDQSTEEGVLGDAFLGATAKGKAKNLAATIPLGRIFVIGPQHEKADGEVWRGRVWHAGLYRYTTVAGAAKTVHCFAADPQVAIERLTKEKAPE